MQAFVPPRGSIERQSVERCGDANSSIGIAGAAPCVDGKTTSNASDKRAVWIFGPTGGDQTSGDGIVTLDRLEAVMAGRAALFLEPRNVFDVAIVGIAEQADGLLTVAYDSERLVLALMNQEGWDEDTAREWYEFNMAGAFVGPETPMLIEAREDDSF